MNGLSFYIGACVAALIGLSVYAIWQDAAPSRLDKQYRYRVELPTSTFWCDYYEVVPNGVILLPDTTRITGCYSILRTK